MANRGCQFDKTWEEGTSAEGFVYKGVACGNVCEAFSWLVS